MAAQAGTASAPAVALDVKDIHKSYGAHEVLKGISLAAHDHDVVAILGSSGSGKSTFLRCINLLETPNSGEVRVKGELIRMTDRRGAAGARRHEAGRPHPLEARHGVPAASTSGST